MGVKLSVLFSKHKWHHDTCQSSTKDKYLTRSRGQPKDGMESSLK